MFLTIDWDTSTVLTAILGPLCLLFLGILFAQWQRINELKNDLKTEEGKAVKLTKDIDDLKQGHSKTLETVTTEKNTEIERQKEEIEKFHKLNKERSKLAIPIMVEEKKREY